MQFKYWFSLVLAAGAALGVSAQDAPPAQTNAPAQSQSATNQSTTNAVLPVPPAQAQGQSSASETRKTRVLSLADCIQLALQNNLDIQIQRFNPIISQYNLNSSYGVYDPLLGLKGSSSFDSVPGGINSSTGIPLLFSTERKTDSYNAGISGLLPSGLTYNITGPWSENNNSVTGTNFATQWNSSPGITLDQPLLKNFWIDQDRLTIRLNKANLIISEEAFRQQVMTTVTAVKSAYYNLIFSRENVLANSTGLKLAQQLASENKTKVQIGTLAPLDEKQAESQAESSKAALLAAQHDLSIQENLLKNLLTSDYTQWADLSPVPAEELVALPQTIDRQESWRRAVAQRPDYLQSKLNVEKQNVTLKFTFNQLFPQLDLTGSYGRNASTGTLDANFDAIRTGNDEFYSYGAALTLPLGNTSARNTHKAAKVTLKQLLLQLKQLENNILTTVDNDVGQVQSTLQQVDATHSARLYASDALDAERKKFENGKSTSFQVLQLISNLTAARSAEIRALADYNIALTQLSLDEGSTLDDNKVDLRVK